ncbi:MAG: class I SAM-dependent methyltransferase [Ilumatobacter sp.]
MAANITFGTGIPGETELRLCGDVSGAKRAVELGVSPWFNSIEFAKAGGKAIAVDADPERITEMRARADAARVTVQCLEADTADLGDIASSSCEIVVAAQTLGTVDDLGRLLRQVHRVLAPSKSFVISTPHPFDTVTDAQPYGTSGRTISDWFTALERANFRVDQVRELGVGPTPTIPTVLVMRARKEGS